MRTSLTLGDYNAICDKCGMKRKASTLSRDWQGLRLCPQCFDTRNPQDFVRGVEDNQTVPWSRSDIKQEQGTTAVKVAGSKGDMTIDIDSITGLSDKDSIGIVVDNGSTDWQLINGTPAVNTVTLTNPLIYPAAVGNAVYIPSINNETFITATGVTATEL